MKKFDFTIAVCTFNRAPILTKCIASILDQLDELCSFEILIIDNNSTDNTSSLVRSLATNNPTLRLVREQKQGLSHARNRAYQEAKTKWIVYIDDDAKLKHGYCHQLIKLIQREDFDCFGGLYTAWYFYGKPPWLPDDFGNKKSLRPSIGLIDGSQGWLSGGNFAIKKAILEEIGGFNPELGMSGLKTGYGEEDYVQKIIFEQGYKIGFDPNLIIEHAVMPHKLKLSWHLKSSFFRGKSIEQMRSVKSGVPYSALELSRGIIGLFLKRLPKAIWFLFRRKEYYWQNLVLDSLNPIYKSLGSLYHIIYFKNEEYNK